MGDAPTVIAIVVAGVIGGVGTWWSARKLSKSGIAQEPDKLLTNLHDLADTWEEKYNLEHEARVNAETDLAAITTEQALERSRGAQCRRDLDDALSQVRDLERRRRTRTPA